MFTATEQIPHRSPRTHEEVGSAAVGLERAPRSTTFPLRPLLSLQAPNMKTPILMLATTSLCLAAQPTYQVSSRGGTHTSLQEAIDACPSSGCRIELPDSLYEFSQPVTIRGKSDLEIRGSRPDGARPILAIAESARELGAIPAIGPHTAVRTHPIVWTKGAPDTIVDPDGTVDLLQDSVHLGPVGQSARFLLHPGRGPDRTPDPRRPAGWMLAPFTNLQAQDPANDGFDMSSYLHASLLLIDSSREVRVSGLEFDGGTPIEFLTQALWDDKWGQQGGVAAISLNGSLRCEILDCNFHGWFVGVRTVDANKGGLASDLMAADQADNLAFWNLRPLSDPGAMGGHRIEDNLAHHNEVFVHLEQSWDLASSIRFNRVWENGKSRMLTRSSDRAIQSKDPQWWDLRGGFVLMKDVAYPSTILQGNSLVRNTLDIGHIGWRASNTQLFFDNLSVRRDEQRDWRELSNSLGVNSRHNWIASTARAAWGGPAGDSIVPFCTAPRCAPLVPAWGAPQIDDHLAAAGLFGDDIGSMWRTSRTKESIRIQDQTLGNVERSASGWKVLLPVPVESSRSTTDLSWTLAQAQKFASVAQGLTVNKNAPTPITSLLNTSIATGVNLVGFELPASAEDSLWLVELAATGRDSNTGNRVHSNLGRWLVRPMGKQLRVALLDSGTVTPGRNVTFAVDVKDSLGQTATLDRLPVLNAPGWTLSPGTSSLDGTARSTSAGSHFEIRATAPSTEGLDRVVFWSTENGRLQAIAGVAYIQVGSSTNEALPRSRPGGSWSISHISRDGEGWRMTLRGEFATEPSEARLLDATGRSWKPIASGIGPEGTLRFRGVPSGTYFLRVGDLARPVILVP